MAVTITVDGVDITDKVRLDGWRVEMAANQGEVGTGRLLIDDITGSSNLAPTATEWSIVASGATPTTIGGGFIGEQGIERGPLVAGTQRQFGPILEDWNTALTDRVFKGSASDRPEESDYQRVNWLLGQDVMGMLDGDGKGQVPNTNTVTMDPTDYRGKTPLDVLDDCAESAGKNYYIYYVSGTGWKLYYDKAGSTAAAFTSSLQLSGDNSDIDGSTVFGVSDVDYEIDPERIYAVLNVKWANGWVYEKNQTTASTYRNLQKTVIKENIKTASRARAWAQRQLAKLNEPTKRLECTVSVPESALGELRAGYRIQVKLPKQGITGFTYFRIAKTTIQPRQGRGGVSDVEYDVRLKMFDKLRPVNLDDNYGGGDSSGNNYTGPSQPPIGGGTGGGGGDASGTSAYVLDGFDRETGSVVPSVVQNNNTTSSSTTSHVITIPTGSNVVGYFVWFHVATDDTSSEVYDAFSDAGFSIMAEYSDQSYFLAYRYVDGSETWTGSGDTFSFTTTSSVTIYARGYTLSGVTDWAVGTSDSADPPSLATGWSATTPKVWWAFGFDDTAIGGGIPSGYGIEDSIGGPPSLWSASKTDDTATDDPSSWTMTGTKKWAATVALEGSGTTAQDVFTDDFSNRSITPAFGAGWGTSSGGADWADGASGSSTYVKTGVVSGEGYSTLGQTGTANNRLFNDVELDFSDDVWEIKADVRLDGTATDDFVLVEFLTGDKDTISISSGGPTYDACGARLTLETGGVYELSVTTDCDEVTGVVWSTQAISFTVGTQYTIRVQRVGTTIRAKIWEKSSSEPDAWTVSDTITDDLSGNKTDFFIYHRMSAVGTVSHQMYIDNLVVSGGSGWGLLPAGGDAPWEGTNEWTIATTGTGSAIVSGGAGQMVILADDSSVSATVTSDGSEPWGPWDEGAEFLVKWKVDVLGDITDVDPNIVEFSILSDGFRGTLRINLGDNVNWSYMDPDQQRGITMWQSSQAPSGFVQKTILADTYYLIRFDVRGSRVRAKMWPASDNEPVLWDFDEAKVDDTTSNGDFVIRAYGNITGGTVTHYFDYIDASLAAPSGGIVSTILPPGNGASTTWTIEPFVGAIKVFVDGIQTAPASFDRDAGTFTFDRAPDLGAVIRVEYTPA